MYYILDIFIRYVFIQLLIEFLPTAWFDQNELLWDLGMNETLLNDFEALRNQIKLYGEEFDVVLIAELFDESLIVLKDFLCWNVEDILFLKVLG